MPADSLSERDFVLLITLIKRNVEIICGRGNLEQLEELAVALTRLWWHVQATMDDRF